MKPLCTRLHCAVSSHAVNRFFYRKPVAAIRSFAENAQGFLAKGDDARADGNLSRIVELTQRIGTITAELRNFARRRTPETGPVDVDAVIESTLLLIGDRVSPSTREQPLHPVLH